MSNATTRRPQRRRQSPRSDTRLYLARRGVIGTYRGYTAEDEKVIFRVWSFFDERTQKHVIRIFPISYWYWDEEEERFIKDWSAYNNDRPKGERAPFLPGCILFGSCDLDRVPDVMAGDVSAREWSEVLLDVVKYYDVRERAKRSTPKVTEERPN